LRILSSISGEPFRNYNTFCTSSPYFKMDQKYWDKITYRYMFIIVGKALVFGHIFLARNDYTKLVTTSSVSFGCVSDDIVPNRNEW
jgi:hypothetical protein